MKELVLYFSNGLSILMLVSILCVLWLWKDNALFVLKSLFKSNQLNATGYFIIGVFLGFLGAFFDNLYWTVVWFSKALHYPHFNDLLYSGVYNNIVFRQTLGILSAYCHIRSALLYTENTSLLNRVHRIFLVSAIVGLWVMIYLLRGANV